MEGDSGHRSGECSCPGPHRGHRAIEAGGWMADVAMWVEARGMAGGEEGWQERLHLTTPLGCECLVSNLEGRLRPK